MNFGQLTECSTRNFFLKNHIHNVVRKIFPDPSKLSISQDQLSKILCSLFLLYAKIRAIEGRRPLAFTLFRASLKNKKRSGTTLAASFST